MIEEFAFDNTEERRKTRQNGTGWIEVITGSMFSGKSEELIRRLNRARIARQKVQVFKPADLDEKYDVTTDQSTSAWEALHHAIRILESGGVLSAGLFLRDASQRTDGAVDLDLVKELAYLLFQIAEKNGWTKDAISFNALATAWPELMEAARTASVPSYSTSTLDFGDDA